MTIDTLRLALRLLLVVIGLVGFGAAGQTDLAVTAPDVVFELARDGDAVVIEAHAYLSAPPSLVWAVLTDYERYPDFVSSMSECRVVSNGERGLVIEQKGQFRFLFFTQDIVVRLLVNEVPQSVVSVRAIGGNIRELIGRYELEPLGEGVRLRYSGRLIPDFGLPSLFGTTVARLVLRRYFAELIDEILRRNALMLDVTGRP